jgi:hypothetical protein
MVVGGRTSDSIVQRLLRPSALSAWAVRGRDENFKGKPLPAPRMDGMFAGCLEFKGSKKPQSMMSRASSSIRSLGMLVVLAFLGIAWAADCEGGQCRFLLALHRAIHPPGEQYHIHSLLTETA